MNKNDFLLLLQAKLDKVKSKRNINADINKIQAEINKLKIQAVIDPKTISNLIKQLESVLNQKINISNVDINQNALSKIEKLLSGSPDGITSSLESMSISAENAESETAVAMDSINDKLNEVKETGTGIFQNLFDRKEVQSILDTITSLGDRLNWLDGKIQLIAGISLIQNFKDGKSKLRFCPSWM